MIACAFDQETGVLGPPVGMTEEEVYSLSVCQTKTEDGTPVVISCWKLTTEEAEEFRKTGRIWLIVNGHTMPPVAISANSPFGEQ